MRLQHRKDVPGTVFKYSRVVTECHVEETLASLGGQRPSFQADGNINKAYDGCRQVSTE